MNYKQYIPITQLNKAIHEPVRLAIISILYIHTNVDFIFLKKVLNLSNGNLNSHLKRLENENIIKVQKGYLHKRPHSVYWLTYEGRHAFEEYIKILHQHTQEVLSFMPYNPM